MGGRLADPDHAAAPAPGVALIHWLVKALQASRGWLVGVYALYLLAMPHAQVLTAGLGLADIWVNVRSRVRPRQADNH